MLKQRVTDTTLKFPQLGNRIEFEVKALKEDEKFIVNNRRKCRHIISNGNIGVIN